MRISILSMLSFIAIFIGTIAQAQKDVRDSQDHPLIERYPGTFIKNYSAIEYDRALIITGPIQKRSNGQDATETEILEGQVINIRYNLKKGEDQFLEVVKNYQSAFERLNANILFSCLDAEECARPSSDQFTPSRLPEFRQTDKPFLRGLRSLSSNKKDYAILTATLNDTTSPVTVMIIISKVSGLTIEQSIVSSKIVDDQKIEIGDISNLPKVASDASRVRKDKVKGSKDHPLLKRYPGFYIDGYAQVEFDKAAIATGPFVRGTNANDDKAQNLPILELEGQVTNIHYTSEDPTASTYQIFLNYTVALQKLGADILYSCENTQECARLANGESDNRIDKNFWQNNPLLFKGISVVGATDSALLSAKLEQGETIVHFLIVAIADHANGRRKIYQSVIVDTPFDANKVGIGSVQDLTVSIADSGAVVLEGVLFEFDSDALLIESGVVLDIVNEYIAQNSNAEFFVVGHTDSTGNYKYNLDLSKRRATSVVKYLVKNGANAKNLFPVGVGSVSPIANNETEVGQKSNRRVELVIR